MAAIDTEDPLKNVSTEELEAMKEVFHVFDTNGDGKIDADELQAAFSNFGVQRRKSSMIRMIDKFDENDNQALELEEFLQVLKFAELDGAVADMLKDRRDDRDSEGYQEDYRSLGKRLGGKDLSADDVEASIFGRASKLQDETPEKMAAAIQEFDKEIKKAKASKRKNLDLALKTCPERFTDDFKIMFLRSELYNASKAVTRCCKFWDKMVELFGKKKAFLPLTQEGALRDDQEFLKIPFVVDTHTRDKYGQHIMFFDWNEDDKRQDAKGMCRLTWYVMQHMIENDQEAQKNGVVFVARSMKSVGDWNMKTVKQQTDSLRFCAPMRLGGMHFCYPPRAMTMLFNIGRVFMGELRSRMKVHPGETAELHQRLKKYGLEPDMLPTQLGGTVQLNHVAWVEEMAKQGK